MSAKKKAEKPVEKKKSVSEKETVEKNEAQVQKTKEQREADAEKLAEENFKVGYKEGSLTEDQLSGSTIDVIQKYADKHSWKYLKSSTKKDLIKDVLKKESAITIVDDIKNVGKEIDKLYSLSKDHLQMPNLILISIFRAKCWLGKLLSYMGEELSENDLILNKDFIQERSRFLLESEKDAVLLIVKRLGAISEEVEKFDLSAIDKENQEIASICKTECWAKIIEAQYDLKY